MRPAALTVEVYVAPMRPFHGAPAQGSGDEPMWSPMSSTLIAGAEEAILVDTTIPLDQVDALANGCAASASGSPASTSPTATRTTASDSRACRSTSRRPAASPPPR